MSVSSTEGLDGENTMSETFEMDPRAPYHLIDDDGEYTGNVDKALKVWNMENRGLDYKMVAILGSQSGGKSTLLNMLFGTSFPMMDAKHRRQCTKGIFLSHGDTEDILVYDVEGTDGRERGEEQADFERKTSLFSFALAQVVIVNLWTHDIGRYHGANLGLLKIVLELNLQLFQKNKNSRTLLLFTIRDYDHATPKEDLTRTLNDDMNNIWSGISKPAGHENTSFLDFFDLAYVCLANKNYEEAKFREDVAALRKRFTDPSDPDYVWSDAYERGIPIDGLPHYLGSLWSTIKENKDLDLPLQKVMLAMHRCTQISSEQYARFAAAIAPIRAAMKAGENVEGFGKQTGALLESVMEQFAEETRRYDEETVNKMSGELREKICTELQLLFNEQLRKIRIRATEKFEALLKTEIPDKEEPVENFSTIVRSVTANVWEYFDGQVADATVPGAEWSAENEKEELELTIEKRVAIERDAQLKKMNDFLAKKLRLKLLDPMKVLLNESPEDMWAQIRATIAAVKTQSAEVLETRLAGFDCSEDEIKQHTAKLGTEIRENVAKTVKDNAGGVILILQNRFEKLFVFNNEQLPRQWQETDNIRSEYTRCLKLTVELINLHAILRLDPALDELDIFTSSLTDLPDSAIVLGKHEATVMKADIEKHALRLYNQARDDQERARSGGQLKMFLVLLFLFFAYDDLYAYVQNPFIFMFTLFVGGSTLVLWYLGMLGVVTPYLLKGVNTGMATAKEQVVDRVKVMAGMKEKNE